MSSLYRPTYTKVDPATGERTVRRVAKWWGKYRDSTGNVRRVALSANRAAAQLLLAELVKASEMGRAVADPYAQHRHRPLAEHLADWQLELTSRGNTAPYVRLKVGRVRRLVTGCGFERIADLSASRVESWLAELRKGGAVLDCGQGRRWLKSASQQTSNHYLAAAREFAAWLVADGRTERSALARLSGGNVEIDRRHVRRALTDAELGQLLAALPSCPDRVGLSAADRRLLYLTALYTGLRASELASLQTASFQLGAAPTVTVEAGYSKHRRRDTLPLHPALVLELTPWLAGKAPGALVWPGNWARGKSAGVILQADLAAAGVPYRTAKGVADFHALRHTYVTRVVLSGASVKEAQELARHSDVRLTLERYSHLGLLEMAAAILRMPALPLAESA